MTPQDHARDLILRLAAMKPEGNDVSDLLVTSFEAAINEERARCAAVADRFKSTSASNHFTRGQHSAAVNIALAIREPDQSKWAAMADAGSA
jgi:hypothetical protein